MLPGCARGDGFHKSGSRPAEMSLDADHSAVKPHFNELGTAFEGVVNSDCETN